MHETPGVRVEEVLGAASPAEQARAEEVRNRSESNTVAGAYALTERLIRRRADELDKREAELEQREARLRQYEEGVRRREEAVWMFEPTMATREAAILSEAHKQAQSIAADAERKATGLLVETSEVASSLRVRAVADAEFFRTEARELLTSSSKVGEEARKIQPPAVTGAATVAKLGEHLITTVGSVFERVFTTNPALVARAVERVSSLMGGPAPDSGPAWTMGDVARAVEQLGPERIAALLQGWGRASIDDISQDEAAQLVTLARSEQGGGDAAGS